MDALRLKGLDFYGYHGTEDWEKEAGRRFLVDLTLHADLSAAGMGDRLEDAFDYCTAYAAVKRVVIDETHDLIERVAWRVMEELFKAFPAAGAVTVCVSKSEAPIGGLNTCAQIEYSRTREAFEAINNAKG